MVPKMDDEADDAKEVSTSSSSRHEVQRVRRDEYLKKVSKALSRHLWYHGLMPRAAVEDALKKDGDFLVRKTDKDGKQYYCLSVMSGGAVCHVIIHCKNRQWSIRQITKPTLTELIITHFNEQIPIKSDGTLLKAGIPRSNFHIMHDDVELGDKIGSGAYGEVCHGILRTNNGEIEVAVKSLKNIVGKHERVKLVNEANIICQLDHPNIVKIFGIAPLEEPMLMVLEFVPGGGLPNHLKKHPELSVETLCKYVVDAARGMCYLSSRGIVHRDVAARNCLLGAKNDVKIADFGMSIVVQEEFCKLDRVGKVPIRWLAPESLKARKFSVKSDVWSFGVLIWEIFTRRKDRPYADLSNSEAKKHVLAGKTLRPPQGTPSTFAAVMERCFNQSSDHRPDFVGILRMLSPNERPPVPDAIGERIMQIPTTNSSTQNRKLASVVRSKTQIIYSNGTTVNNCHGGYARDDISAKTGNSVDRTRSLHRNKDGHRDGSSLRRHSRKARKSSLSASKSSLSKSSQEFAERSHNLKVSLKERVIMRITRRSSRRSSSRDTSRRQKAVSDCALNGSTTTATANDSYYSTIHCLMVKKMKSLSPCKSPNRIVTIPNVFQKNEKASNFCFTNVKK